MAAASASGAGRGEDDGGGVDDEVPAWISCWMDMVAALESSLIAVAKAILKCRKVDLHVHHLAVARVGGVGGVQGVLAGLQLSERGIDIRLEFGHVVG